MTVSGQAEKAPRPRRFGGSPVRLAVRNARAVLTALAAVSLVTVASTAVAGALPGTPAGPPSSLPPTRATELVAVETLPAAPATWGDYPVQDWPESRHWYMVPTEANSCHLNIRSGPSTADPVLLRLSECDKGPWCWYQLNDCGRWEPPEVVGGAYSCRDDKRRVVQSDRWTVVAITSTRKAFVASRCGRARQV